MTPVKIWRTKTVSAALPKTYHQLADRAGTWCAATSRTVPPICSRSSNQRQIFSSIRLLLVLSTWDLVLGPSRGPWSVLGPLSIVPSLLQDRGPRTKDQGPRTKDGLRT